MTNIQLQQLLATYDDNMPVKLSVNNSSPHSTKVDFTEDNIVLTSTTAYANDEAPEDEWDNDSGKIELGDGERYLLLNSNIQ